MARATVFVDDAVLGRLPSLCVFDGVATDRQMTFSRLVSGRSIGIAWLLVLLGPLGWIGLLLVAVARGREEVLTVEVPCSPAAGERRQRLRRRCLADVTAMVGALVIGVCLLVLAHRLTLQEPSPWATLCRFSSAGFAVGAVALLAKLVRDRVRFGRYRIGVSLDASRRWVTLSGVHEEFASAVREAHAVAVPLLR